MPGTESGDQSMPGPSSGNLPSTGSNLPSASGTGKNEPWADIGDGDSGNSYEDFDDSDIGSSNESNYGVEPDFSDTEPEVDNGEAVVLFEESQVSNNSDLYTNGGTSNIEPAITVSEHVAILDEQLNTGTAEFDEMILNEREAIRRSASGDFSEAEDIAENSDAYPGTVYDAGNRGGEENAEVIASTSTGTKGDYKQAGSYPSPADIPDGNDDDVVARQLREAAMREPDPALREKLWEEYRKYKGIE